MIRAAIPFLFHIPIIFMTDSSFVLQVLQQHCQFNCHPNDIHELLSLWSQVCSRVTPRHVKGHSGHPLNTVTDAAARAALSFPHCRTVYRTADFSKVYLITPPQPMPHFYDWI